VRAQGAQSCSPRAASSGTRNRRAAQVAGRRPARSTAEPRLASATAPDRTRRRALHTIPTKASHPARTVWIVATIRPRLCSLAAALLVTFMMWAWSTGENGDLGFASLCAAVALAGYGFGAWARSWWIVPALAAGWFSGWTLTGELVAPDGYTSIVAYFAPGVALFAALGTGAARPRLPCGDAACSPLRR
jgi:hypothetical protein